MASDERAVYVGPGTYPISELRRVLARQGLYIVADAEMTALKRARDDLRSMFRRWHTSGPHATDDATTIEKTILALDEELARRKTKR